MSHQNFLQSHIYLLQIFLPDLLDILSTKRPDLVYHMCTKLLEYFIKVGSEYLGIEWSSGIEIWVLVVYVDQFLGGIGDRRGRWSRCEVLSTVSDVEHRCFEVLIKGVVINGILAP